MQNKSVAPNKCTNYVQQYISKTKKRIPFDFSLDLHAFAPFALSKGAIWSIKFEGSTRAHKACPVSSLFLSHSLCLSPLWIRNSYVGESPAGDIYSAVRGLVSSLFIHPRCQYPRGVTESAWQHNGRVSTRRLLARTLSPPWLSDISYVWLYGQEHADQNFTLAIAVSLSL